LKSGQISKQARKDGSLAELWSQTSCCQTRAIEFEKILKELKQAHYDGTLTLEVFSQDRGYVEISRDKVKRMWEEG